MAKWRGGQKLKRFIRTAKRAPKASSGVDVGWFRDAKYPPVRTGKRGGGKQSPVYAAAVALWNEFGTQGGGWGGPIPERPFIRNALRDANAELIPVLKESLDPKTMTLDKRSAGRLGATMVGMIQTSITTLRTPPNSPVTRKIKGSSNPLFDTGFLRASTTYRVD